jgi:hypothetical protein
MRSRAVLLPYPGDPYLLNYWLKFYDDIWGKEVDKLYIYLNSTIEPIMVDYIKERVARSKNTELIYSDHQIEHGDVIDKMLNICREKYVVLLEDDCYIFKPNHLDACFRRVESGLVDVVASKRGSCSTEISDQAQKKWGLNYQGYGDQGCNFWPNLFFSEAALLKKTDRDFKAKAWDKGQQIKSLRIGDKPFIVEAERIVGDTFVNTSLQVRDMVKKERIGFVPQYHGSPLDLDDYSKRRNLWDGLAPWVHVGSLSTGVGGILLDDFGRPLARRKIDPAKQESKLPNHCNTAQERLEFERRVQWWLTFWEYANPTPETKDFYEQYEHAIQRIINQFGLNKKNILKRQAIYKEIGL